MNPVDLFVTRAFGEEGLRQLPYDDATGKPVAAPIGNLSWGIGFNLMQCGSRGLFVVMLTYLANEVAKQLQGYAWYQAADPVRQSVFIDIGYNAGVGGLLHFPHMLSFAAVGDWTSAAAECKVADSKLDAQRYAPLRGLLLSGALPT